MGAEPIALLLPNSNTTAKGKKRSNDATTTTTATLQTPFECTWKVDVSQFPYFDGGWQGVVSRATPMDMMWAYFSTPPVPIQGSTQEDGAGAGIRMHSAFGTFEIDFRKQLVQQEQNGGEGGAGEDDGGKKARRKMVIRAHAVVMVRLYTLLFHFSVPLNGTANTRVSSKMLSLSVLI
ncbi:hypothetical protein QFC24_006704 [Naganishia onofrii]|uniref:Uncharacterized protein n=1 Tax=Naganishia onofrii TaxID=1851511 RepID=A0ACC2WZI6_9TREE|nr:hypothetical protein QFC24_006704 [Naganishia onofrii]